MKETAVLFGSHGGLVGVLTTPASTPAQVAVLVSNVGMHHRVGPFRVNVDLARALAAAGIATLRFDRSGVGDSLPRTTPGNDHDHAMRDMSEAMDWLTARLGITQFVQFALCSGVDVAHETTVRDPRVVGAVFIDGYAYSTAGFRWRRTLPRLIDAQRVKRFVRRRWYRAQHPAFFVEPPGDGGAAIFTRRNPTLEEFRNDIRAMASRGTRVLMVYTGAMGVHLNSPKQLYEMVGEDVDRERVSVAWMPDADHLFSTGAARQALVERVVRWVGLAG
jgi:pimeloyl-ACP methyl ester carboxylesterase